MPNFNHFNFLAPYYDRFIKTTNSERFSVLLGLPISGSLLDVGGGTGGKSHALMNMVSKVIVVDSSMGMLFQAQKKEGLIPICSASEQLPFGDGSFERIIMVDALHHVNDYKLTTNELWRMLKPAGRIVIEEPNIEITSVKIMALIEKLALMRSHFISPQDIGNLFNYPNARIEIEINEATAWIIVDKQIE